METLPANSLGISATCISFCFAANPGTSWQQDVYDLGLARLLSAESLMSAGPGWIQMASRTHLVVGQLLVQVMRVTEPRVFHLPIG